MSNKIRAINRANLLLEKRYLIEDETSTSSSDKDVDGNLWYVGKVPNINPAKYRIYVQLKGESGGTDGPDVETKNPELWKKVSPNKNYFINYNTENDAMGYLKILIQTINGFKNTGGTPSLNVQPAPGEMTRQELINFMAQNFENQNIGSTPT
jgi:hypothetical protein